MPEDHTARPLRVFIAGLATETNTFAPFPTGMAAFEANGITRTGSIDGDPVSILQLGVYRRRALEAGAEVVESISAVAAPGGKTVLSVYQTLRDRILDDLRAAGQVDLVLLALHGAMVAEGCDDCEGDLLQRTRALVPNAVIGAEFDLHCHLTAAMVEAADVITIYKEYPHIDLVERAEELVTLSLDALEGRSQPVAALIDTRMVGLYPTFSSPMREIVADLRAAEARPGILSASIAHGFPWADVEDMGTRVLVYADGDLDLARREAAAIAETLYAQRHALWPTMPDIATSLDRAAQLTGRVVLGDYSDNPGGGAPGDSTFFLRALIDRDADQAVIGCFHDPAVAQIAADAGVGALIQVRLGGKSGPASGDPIDLAVEVMAVMPNYSQKCFEARQPMGLTVWLRHRGIDILVNSLRSQVYGVDLFSGCGIDIDRKRLIVVKSSTHYEADFGPFSDHIWSVRTPGALTFDFSSLKYTKHQPNYFPQVDDPWAVSGRPVAVTFPWRGQP